MILMDNKDLALLSFLWNAFWVVLAIGTAAIWLPFVAVYYAGWGVYELGKHLKEKHKRRNFERFYGHKS